MENVTTPPSALTVFCKEPYRIFFPLGFVYALIGGSHWIWFHLGWTTDYGAAFHAFLQIQGFGTAFAVGFLMTALPRFLETPHARPWEVAAALLLSITAVIAAGIGAMTAAHALFLALFLHVLVFGLRCFLCRQCPPPPEFVFILSGFVHAVMGAILILWPITGYIHLGERMVQQGMLLSFIMGFGTYLGTRLLGFFNPAMQTIQIQGPRSRRLSPTARKALIQGAVALTLFGSFWIESAGHPTWGRALRAIAVTLQLGLIAGLIRPPRRHFLTVYLLWLSFLFTMTGLWLLTIIHAWETAMLHVTFLGGFGLMILIISMRVTVAHGGFEAFWQKTSAGVILIGAATLLALALRVAAQFWIEHYIALLAASAVCWNIALITWAICLIPKMAPRHVEGA